MSLRDKIEHAIQNQPCMVKDLKAKFGATVPRTAR